MKYTASLLFIITCTLFNCGNTTTKPETATIQVSQEINEKHFVEALQKHLNAVSKKDLETLQSTLSPDGNMQLILPQSETTTTTEAFIAYHKEWFAVPIAWTFDTKILNTKVGKNLGMAVVEVVYREPLRDGKPYFNRMVVSYDLEKINGHWYFIKDHASSIEKSTDKQ